MFFACLATKKPVFVAEVIFYICLSLKISIYTDGYIRMSFKTPEAVWYAPAPAPWITSGDG